MSDHEYFLGGRDLEMEVIRRLLDRHAPGRVHDRRLAWGARASAYAREIDACFARGATPVLVELDDDVGAAARGAIGVDHHGPRADGPTALEQVFQLLGRPRAEWTREYTLVAANDRGHIDAMLEAGATAGEVARIRAADRAAQGITAGEEAEAAAAVARAEHPARGLTVVRLPHARTAAVTDRLHRAAGGPGYRVLAVISPGEVNVFGPPAVVAGFDRQFAGGWRGAGYWGIAPPPETFESALASLAGAREG